MKQTVKEAARKEYPDTIYLQFYGDGDVDNAGEISHENVTWCEDRIYPTDVEYAKVKSPWISVKERLPEQNELVLCRMVSNGAIVSGYIFVEDKKTPRVATQGSFEFEDWNDYECDMWMSIPSFDDILDANKDVLERIKNK